jgi:ankyrin repeat protein
MYGNTRIVRKLLLKGANRYIKNNSGLYPIQVAKQNSFPTIFKMLNE